MSDKITHEPTPIEFNNNIRCIEISATAPSDKTKLWV